MPYSRLATDVDDEEEAELRKMVRAPSPEHDGLEATASTEQLCVAPAVLNKEAGTVRLFTDRLEWTAAASGGRVVTLPLGQIDRCQQNKVNPGVQKVQLRVLLTPEAGGAAHTLDMTDGVDFDASLERRNFLRDALQQRIGADPGPGGGPSGGGSGAPPRPGSRPQPASRPSSRPAEHEGEAARGACASAAIELDGGAAAGTNRAVGATAGSKRPRDEPAADAPSVPATSAAGRTAAGAGGRAGGGSACGSGGGAARVSGESWRFDGWDSGLDGSERDTCEEMLSADGELARLYRDLVHTTQVLTPTEFWQQRRGEMYAVGQQRGFASRALDESERASADERMKKVEREAAAQMAAAGGAGAGGGGRTGDGGGSQGSGGSQVTIKLTVAMKQRIFADYPQARRRIPRVALCRAPPRTPLRTPLRTPPRTPPRTLARPTPPPNRRHLGKACGCWWQRPDRLLSPTSRPHTLSVYCAVSFLRVRVLRVPHVPPPPDPTPQVLAKFNQRDGKSSLRWVRLEPIRILWGDAKTRKCESGLFLTEATSLQHGAKSANFYKKHAAAKRHEDWLCFSIVFKERTLDFAATSLEQLLDWYLAIASVVPQSTEPLLNESELRARIEQML